MNKHQEQMIEHLVQWIEARGLSSAAILLLEANKPLALFGGQALLFLQPFLSLVDPVLGGSGNRYPAAEWADLLENPAGIERILERLER